MIARLRARPDLWRFAKFLAVGVLNTAFGYVAWFVFYRFLGFSPGAALVPSYALGVLWNYLTHARLVFGAGGIARLPQYVAAYLAVLGANMAAMRGLIVLGLVPALAQALLLVPMAALAFVLVSLALTGRLPFGRTR
ncbi:MAG: GtrA family protein [Defluviimonas sp.]|uniref:GtrA family protein n=1 Tax=Albidovulum sp. TaxID=1872424 RepID=UPI001D32123F|nr:GtrA family protein [Paracoccaceae bacterium]MCC0064020.1 GtrA family protein [Defluviimonas sp.]